MSSSKSSVRLFQFVRSAVSGIPRAKPNNFQAKNKGYHLDLVKQKKTFNFVTNNSIVLCFYLHFFQLRPSSQKYCRIDCTTLTNFAHLTLPFSRVHTRLVSFKFPNNNTLFSYLLSLLKLFMLSGLKYRTIETIASFR